MALATQCPHCGTMFRVASDQLKLRGGIVRCGACQEIFDGSAALVDLDQMARAAAAAPLPAEPESLPVAVADSADADAPALAPDVTPDTPAPTEETAPEAQVPSFTIVEADDAIMPEAALEPAVEPSSAAPVEADEVPVYTLDFDHTFDPFGILPKVAADEDEAAPASEPASDEVEAAPAPADVMPPEPAQDAVEAHAEAEPDLVEVDAVTDAAPELAAEPEVAPEAEPAPEAELAPEPEAAPEPASEDAIDADASAQPAPAAAMVPAPAADGQGRVEPAFGLPVDEELVAVALPGHGLDAAPASEPATAPDTAPAAAPATAPAAAADTAPVAPHPVQAADDAPPLPMREAVASTVSVAPSPTTPSPVRTPAARRAEKAAAARRSKLTPTRIEAQPKLRAAEIDEPEFVKRGRQQEQSGRARKIAMLAGSVLLLLLLAGQGAVTFRNAIAARFPAAKPVLVSSCALLGCRVELPAQVDNLVIETGELTTLGGGTYSFTTELRNTASTAQAWPSLELALTDANDKPLVRRVFGPGDYLAAGTPLAAGIAPRTEQAIKLHFRVDDLKPSGYHIAVFYP